MSGIQAHVSYEDPYVQPLILSALAQLPDGSFNVVAGDSSETCKLQIRAYESIDFEAALSDPSSLVNAYVIRKALIRKHYLSNTISTWLVKHPDSLLRRHFKPAVEFEVDYAEFLDEALVEAFELQEAFQHNELLPASERAWWILKPGMSDRGQGIRLFSTEDELREIFEQWEADNPDDDDDEEEEEETRPPKDYIVTSHLRHFLAQPYIHPTLLFPSAPFNNRKFHIRTYAVAAGALRVYVYQPMLALFASQAYTAPWDSAPDDGAATEDLLQRMRDVHLTNTCVQSASRDPAKDGTHPSHSVFLLDELPLLDRQNETLRRQIGQATAELFRAALPHPTHFQPLPQSFEVFGLDFLVTPSEDQDDDGVRAWLLEVNAFPDFAQTGPKLRDAVVKGLWEEVATCVIGPHFNIDARKKEGDSRLVKVLDIDAGRR